MEECLLVPEHNALINEKKTGVLIQKGIMVPSSFIRKLKIPLQIWNKAIGGKSPLRVGCIVGQLYLAQSNGWKSLFQVKRLYTCKILLKTWLMSFQVLSQDSLLCFSNDKPFKTKKKHPLVYRPYKKVPQIKIEKREHYFNISSADFTTDDSQIIL